jgi:peptidoglycan/LPS O-acetylase OafA/YrhL
MSREIAYRGDIDGLRAIAVAMVIVFHLFDVMPGGFIGVDVFFVISGYLITAILLREAGTGDLSIRRFYERRVRRIAPALLTVIAVSSVAAVFLLLPTDLAGFGKSVIATLSFVSNIYFWRDSDYFSPVAATKPLLHTWSLGIEEQFYIVVPLLVALSFRLHGRRLAMWLMLALSAGSLLLTLAVYQFGKGNVAFYLLPTRAWELGFGAMLAFVQSEPRGKWIALAGSALGLALIAAFAFEHDPYRLSPVPLPLPAVVGATLLLWAGQRDNPISRVLATRPMVSVGLLSYSLYLWHWPINVFARYWLVRNPVLTEKFAILGATIVFSWASWRYIERPFRSRAMSIGQVLTAAGSGAALAAIAAAAFIAFQGLPFRLPARAERYNAVAGTNYRCPPTSLLLFADTYACPMNLSSGRPTDATVALLGDSFAQMYLPAVSAVLRRTGQSGILVPANGCLPFTGFNTAASCATAFRANRQAIIATPAIRLVIIAASWENMEKPLTYADGRPLMANDRWSMAEADLTETIRAFRAAGKKVALVSPIATPGFDLASVAGRNFAYGRGETIPLAMPRAEFDRRFGRIRGWMAARSEGTYHRYECLPV